MTAFQKTPFSIIRSGSYAWYSGGLGSRGSYGYYWSSRTYSSTGARALGFYASYFNPQSGGNKPDGFTVRCVVR